MDKDLERCHLTKQILNEYSEETTIHGIHYLVDSNRSKCEKFYWAVMCFASITACSVLIRNVVIKSRQTPVIVTFGDQTIPVYEVLCIVHFIFVQKISYRIFNNIYLYRFHCQL